MRDARSANYGLPQTRERVYVVMIDESLADDAVMNNFSHIVTSVLPESMGTQATLMQVRSYVSTVLAAHDQVPTEHSASKDQPCFSQLAKNLMTAYTDDYSIYGSYVCFLWFPCCGEPKPNSFRAEGARVRRVMSHDSLIYY